MRDALAPGVRVVECGDQLWLPGELGQRRAIQLKRRLKEARFPVLKTLGKTDLKLWPGIEVLQVRELAGCVWVARSRLGENRGTREFVEALQLHGRHPKEAVEQAVGKAAAQQAFSREAVQQLIVLQEDSGSEPEPLPAQMMPGVTDRPVPASDTFRYDALLSGGEQ